MSIFTPVRNTSTKSKLDVTPTSILIIFAPWFLLLLFWGAPKISASPVPHLDVGNRGHTVLDLNLNTFSLGKSSATLSQGRYKDSFSGSGSGAGTEKGRVGQDQGHGIQLPKNPHPNLNRNPYIPVPVQAPVLDYKGETRINRMRRDTDESGSPVEANHFFKRPTKATTTTTTTPAPTTTTTTTTPKTTTTTPVPAVPDTTTADFKDYSNKESICYQLCKGGMGGVACDCDLVPIG